VTLVRLSIWATHGSHCTQISDIVYLLSMLRTGPWRNLVHWRTLGAGLHVHHLRLLVTLLRALVAHHWRARSRAVGISTVGAGGTRHVSWVLWVCRARGWRVHRHLRVPWHTHVWTVRRLIRHHMPTHCWSWRTDKLARLDAHVDMLDVRTHSILLHWNLLRVARHGLRLSTISIRRHRSRRGVHR
jgi:hypothetical protein